MHICYVVNNNPSLMRATMPARHLLRRGYEVDVVVVADTQAQLHIYGGASRGLQLTRVRSGWRSPSRVKELLGEISPDVIHAIGTGRATFWPGLRYRQSCPDTVLITDIDERLSAVYPFPKNWIMWRWESIALAQSDLVVVVSEAMQQHFSQRVPPANMTYLPNGVDLERFDEYSQRADEIRQDLGEGPIVTYMGFMLPQYQTDRVVKVAHRVSEIRPEVRFVLIGKGPDRSRLESMSRELGLDDTITFTGFVSDEDLPGYLTASDVLLFPIEDTPINRARCPNKTFLYCAAQVPIVTNPVGEVKNTLGDYARYFDFDSDEDFANAIIETLDTGKPCPPPEIAERHCWAQRTTEYIAALQGLAGLEDVLSDV